MAPLGILIFSSPKRDEHAQANRFEEAGAALGIDVVRVHEPRLVLANDGSGIRVLLDGKPFLPADCPTLVCRPNFVEEPSLHQFTIQALIDAGFRIVNGSIVRSKNKLDQHVHLARAGVAMPRWAIAHTSERIVESAREIGFPVVCKVPFGTHGKGVFFAPDAKTLQPLADYLSIRDKNTLIVEEFVAEAGCRDLRAFVVGGKVVGAMERVAKEDDIRANASIGGTGQPVVLSPEEEAVALAATRAFDLEISGVDIIRSSRGPLVMEVNANPGFKELEEVTGIDIAGEILKYAAGVTK